MLFSAFLSIVSVDPSIGRIDKASLPPQTLLELFLQNATDVYIIFGFQNPPPPISQWRGLHIEENGEVTEISWLGEHFYGSLGGSIAVEWLPDSLKRVQISSHGLTGSVDLSALPKELIMLNMSGNRLSGEISLDALPSKIVELQLGNNLLTGSLNLKGLQASLRELHLGKNKFNGSIDLTQLPPFMIALHLNSNMLCGETDFTKLPNSLEVLNIDHTDLEGKLHIKEGKNFSAEGTKVSVTRE